MKNSFTNERVVKRNARIAQITMLSGLVVLGAGMFISFRMPEQFAISLAALLVGFALSQIGIYFSNRWGRRPRPDELLDQALKGLDNKYALYHYYGPVSHMLISPAGVWALLPFYQRGRIVYENGRWRQKGGNLYMKIFAQEGLGRPELDAGAEIEQLKRFLANEFPDEEIPVHAALVFTHPKVEVDVDEEDGAPAYTVRVNDLKDLVRKKSKERRLSPEKAAKIRQAVLPGETEVQEAG